MTTIRPTVSRLEFLGLLVIVAVGALHLQMYAQPFEDSYISYRYAENFADGLGLVFNAGERVEGFTCFAWVVLLGGVAAMGLPLDLVAPLLGQGFAIGSLVLVWAIARRIAPAPEWASLLAPAWLAAHGTWAFFGASGMETPLFLFALLASCWTALHDHPRSALYTGAWWALAAATRPEGTGYVLALAVALAVRRDGRTHAALAFGSYVACFFPVVVARWIYFDALLPNTFHAKSGDAATSLYTGWRYLEAFLTTTAGWMVGLVTVALAIHTRLDRGTRITGAVVAAGMANVLIVGADTFFFHRFLLPVAATFAIIAAAAVGASSAPGRQRVVGAVATTLIVMTAASGFVRMPSFYGGVTPGYDRATAVNRINADYFAIGGWMRDNLPTDATVALNTVGIIPWTSRHVTIDMLGLTDAHIAHHGHVAPDGPIGHQRFDPDYVLGRAPDVIIPGLPVLSDRHVPPQQANEWFAIVSEGLPGDHALLAHAELAANYSVVSVPVRADGWFTFFIRTDRLRATHTSH